MPLCRKPTAAEGTAAQAAGAPSPEWASNRLRNMFCRDIEAAKSTQKKIYALVQQNGRAAVEAALGADGTELVPCYAALKAYIETLDSTASIPDLPA